MTTFVVVKKKGQIAIASDALVTFGETRLSHGYETNEKIFAIGSIVHRPGGQHGAFRGDAPRRCATSARTASSRVAHEVFDDLPEAAHGSEGALLPEPQGRRLRSLRVIADHRVDRQSERHLRRVLVSGSVQLRALLGHRLRPQLRARAMYASYDRLRTAQAIAETGIHAGAEFDKSSSLPVRVYAMAGHGE